MFLISHIKEKKKRFCTKETSTKFTALPHSENIEPCAKIVIKTKSSKSWCTLCPQQILLINSIYTWNIFSFLLCTNIMISTSILLLIIWTCHNKKSSWSIKLRCCLGSKLHSLHIIYPEMETKKKTISGEAEAAGVPPKVPKLPPNVTHDLQCLITQIKM